MHGHRASRITNSMSLSFPSPNPPRRPVAAIENRERRRPINFFWGQDACCGTKHKLLMQHTQNNVH